MCFQYVYKLVSILQFFSIFPQGVFSNTGCFQCFYRLFWTLQVIFINFIDFFSILQGIFFLLQDFFNITCCFQYFYRLFSELKVFSVLLRLVWNITGTFVCFYSFRFHYYRLFSIFLQVIFHTKNYFHYLCRFFLRLPVSFFSFTGYFQFFYRLISIFLQVIFNEFTDFLQYF